MTVDGFYAQQTPQSFIKTDIVQSYFKAWAQVMAGHLGERERIAYIDLFAGPGRYGDGTPSTPLLVLQHAINSSVLQRMLVTIFNDVNPDFCRSLRNNIDALPGVGRLHHKPQVHNKEVGPDLAKSLAAVRLRPTLLFADPCGYTGLSFDLLWSVLKDWGCDCMFFFNYNRINAALSNERLTETVDGFCGPELAQELRQQLPTLKPHKREEVIVEATVKALSRKHKLHNLAFCFKDASGARTSHHLIFLSKHILGYNIMKTIMAKRATRESDGVAPFCYNPQDISQPLLFGPTDSLNDLAEDLLVKFAGQSLKVATVCDRHNVGTSYVKRDYKHALKTLEAQGRITVDPPAAKRPTRRGQLTMANHVTVIFPQRGV